MNELIAYASRTGTRRNLAALRGAGWRLLVSAASVHSNEGFPYAIDNGAWSAFTQGRPIDLPRFEPGCRRNEETGVAQCATEIKPEWVWELLQKAIHEGSAGTWHPPVSNLLEAK